MKRSVTVLAITLSLILCACSKPVEAVESETLNNEPTIEVIAPISESTEEQDTDEGKSEIPELESKDDSADEELSEDAPADDSGFEEDMASVQADIEPVPASQREEAPVQEVVQAVSQVEYSYGAIPFDLAAGTGTWWQIDSTDSAYWAVLDNINAIRAAGGLGTLSMDGGLSTIASERCRSFVEGGPFDHSGMITKSEICASGPLGSASAVCSAWQNSPVHYANIMRADISRLGVGCWFCQEGANQYTYWAVTFE